MHSEIKVDQKIRILRGTFAIIIFPTTIALVLDKRIGLAIFIALLSSMYFCAAAYLVFQTMLPEFTRRQILVLFSSIAGFTKRRDSAILNISGGRVPQNDYSSKRPVMIRALALEPSSAAIILTQQKFREVLIGGVHVFPKNVVLEGLISASVSRIMFGPQNQSSLSPIKSGERLADYHVRINHAKRTQMITADGKTVFPKVEVFYRVNVEAGEEKLLKLYEDIENIRKAPSPIDLNQTIPSILFEPVMDVCRKKIISLQADQINSNLPVSVQSEGGLIHGLSVKIFIPSMFKL